MTKPNPLPRRFRMLMRLYPRAYRARYGQEMEEFFRREWAEGGGLVFWLRLALDHVEAAWHVRRRSPGKGRMGGMRDDLRSALRALRRAPGFTAFAVVTLALGVGATTAVFSVLDAILLRPLPYPASERMVLVGIEARLDPGERGPLSPALVARYQEAPGPAEAVVAASTSNVILTGSGDPERVGANRVTLGFFEFFGARPAVGRLLGDEDYRPGAPRVVVLGHGFWMSRFGGDPGVVGSALRLDDELHTVVGVLSRDFVRPREVADARDLWAPYALTGEDLVRGAFFLSGIARLRSGATLEGMAAHADRTVAELYPPGDGPGFVSGGYVSAYKDAVVGPVSRTLPRVLGAVVLLLLISCVNVAGLLLTRGTERAPEMAVRSALGAGWGRMVRQLLAESTLLAVAGGVLGSALAWASVALFRRYAPPGLPRLEEVTLDGRGLGFALTLAIGAVVLFGLLPALRSARTSGVGDGRLGRRTTAGRGEGRLRGALIAFETALAVVLAVGSTLLASDLIRLGGEETGVHAEGVAVMRLNLRSAYPRAEWNGVWRQLLDGTRGLPGVTSVGLASQAPYDGTSIMSTFRPEGLDDPEGTFITQVVVGGDYADALGVQVVEGRPLGSEDDGLAYPAMVNEAFVRRYWPGESGVGKLVHSGSAEVEEETYEVVGVLGDVRTRVGREVAPAIFVSMASAPWARMELLVRTEGEAAALAEPLRALVRRLDPSLPVWRITTVEGLAAEGLARPRFYTGLFGGFAAVALLLALVGVFGTTSYATRTRVREIGIRMALGARRGRVVGGMVGRTALIVGVGVALGLVLAGVGSRFMTDVLVYVTPRDVGAYGVVAALVLTSGIVAAWIPAGRAGRVDPASTLREEG